MQQRRSAQAHPEQRERGAALVRAAKGLGKEKR
jgi:hypothetical protein